MRFSCTICCELFIPNDDVHAAPCGHILHYNCWTRWLQRSKNCPDCRKSTHVHELFKLFFNLDDGDDYTTLSNKYDALRCDLSCKTKECEAAEKELKLQRTETVKLRQEVQKFKTENEKFKKQSVIGSDTTIVKIGMGMYKDLLKSKEEKKETLKRNEELVEEISKLKKKAEQLEKKKGKTVPDNSTQYKAGELANMVHCSKIVLNLKNAMNDYEELKKNDKFLKNLKVYTDQIDSSFDLWHIVDDDPAPFVEMFRDVKRYLDQKRKREEELSQCPRGCILELSGFPKVTNLTWQDCRRAVEYFGGNVAFVTFNPGDDKAYVRLDKEYPAEMPAVMFASQFHCKHIMLGGVALRAKALQGQEETSFLKLSLEDRDRRNRERMRRRKGFVDSEAEETFLDFCMKCVSETKTSERVVAFAL